MEPGPGGGFIPKIALRYRRADAACMAAEFDGHCAGASERTARASAVSWTFGYADSLKTAPKPGQVQEVVRPANHPTIRTSVRKGLHDRFFHIGG